MSVIYALNMELTKGELKSLLLIYAANVDYSFSDEERELIKKVTTTSDFAKMEALYEKETDSVIFETIVTHLEKFYPTKENKLELAELLDSLFSIDGEYCNFEKSFMAFFNLLIKKSKS